MDRVEKIGKGTCLCLSFEQDEIHSMFTSLSASQTGGDGRPKAREAYGNYQAVSRIAVPTTRLAVSTYALVVAGEGNEGARDATTTTTKTRADVCVVVDVVDVVDKGGENAGLTRDSPQSRTEGGTEREWTNGALDGPHGLEVPDLMVSLRLLSLL